MDNKGLRFAKRFFNTILVLILLVTFAGLCVSIYNSFAYNYETAKYIYVLLGFVMLPLEYLTTGTFSGRFQEQASTHICIIIEIIILFAIILYLSSASSAFRRKNSVAMRKFYSVMSIVLQAIFVGVFGGSLFVAITNYSVVLNALNSFGPDLINKLTTTIGVNVVLIKEVVVASWGFVAGVFALIMFILATAHKSTKVKIVQGGTSFYSSDYEEPKKENKVKEVADEQQAEPAHKEDPRAQELINKIMELEELKKQGRISNVDYTRLRQKAIRRYKK